jgi:hypothetical protein
LFQSLSDFLKVKGVELKDGAYAQRIRRACGLLGDTINATQRTAKKAKVEVDKQLDQLRQSIHEATAPKAPPASAPKPASASAPKTKKAPQSPKRSAASAKGRRK